MESTQTIGAPGGADGGKAAILERVNDIFQDVVSDEAQLTLATTASDIPEWDSLAHVRLILAVERGFKIKFSAAEVSRLNNVGDLVNLIAARQG